MQLKSPPPRLLSQQLVQTDNIEAPHYCQASKVHEAHMEPTWVLSAPGRPHIGPMKLAIRVAICQENHPVGFLAKTAMWNLNPFHDVIIEFSGLKIFLSCTPVAPFTNMD